MPSGRPRSSDTAGRASPTFVRSGNSFFANIFVFLAFSVQGGLGSSDARATGGTITTFGDYIIHKNTSSGIFQVTDPSLTEVEVLIVGGRGAGGFNLGGGGGGWAVLYSENKSLSSSSINVTVGNGGTAIGLQVLPSQGAEVVAVDIIVKGVQAAPASLSPATRRSRQSTPRHHQHHPQGHRHRHRRRNHGRNHHRLRRKRRRRQRRPATRSSPTSRTLR